MTPSASKSKTQKLKPALNKLDTTLQEEFFAKEKKLGNILGETDLSQGSIPLLHPDTKYSTSPVQLQSKFSLAAILMETPWGRSEFYRETPQLACHRKGEQPGHSHRGRALHKAPGRKFS